MVGGFAHGVWHGDGHGAFGPMIASGGPLQGTGWGGPLVAADLDGNGAVDLVMSAMAYLPMAPAYVVLWNDGHGSFAPPGSPLPGGGAPLFAADLDEDGATDLVYTGDNGTLQWVRNQGDGTFAVTGSFDAANGGSPIRVADLDGDGHLDVLTGEAGAHRVSVALGAGDGTFGPVASFEADADPPPTPVHLTIDSNRSSILSADLNGDGLPDLVTAGMGGVSVVLATGGGDYAVGETYPFASGPPAMVAADLNGDGFVDIALIDGSWGRVKLLFGQGNGMLTLGSTIDAAPPGNILRGITALDVNGDGLVDLAVTASQSYYAIPANANLLIVLRNQGGGVFANAVEYTAGGEPTAVAARDLDGDGRPDLVVANSSSCSVDVFSNQGGPLLLASSYALTCCPAELALADVNGDGRLDILAAGGVIDVLLGHGDGTFEPAASFPGPPGIVTADMNGDGALDIVAAKGSGEATVLLGTGDGAFGPGAPYEFGGSRALVAVDLNGDGRPDVAAATGSGVDLMFNTCLP